MGFGAELGVEVIGWGMIGGGVSFGGLEWMAFSGKLLSPRGLI